jgi:hypothetical protein
LFIPNDEGRDSKEDARFNYVEISRLFKVSGVFFAEIASCFCESAKNQILIPLPETFYPWEDAPFPHCIISLYISFPPQGEYPDCNEIKPNFIPPSSGLAILDDPLTSIGK